MASSPEEIEWAGRVVAAFEAARTRGDGAISLEGEFIDRPVYERAKQVLEFAVQAGLL